MKNIANFLKFGRDARRTHELEIKFENVEFSTLPELQFSDDVCSNLDNRDIPKYIRAAL